LSLSGSCLVSSSFSEVWQFKFACCPQVQKISSVVHQLSYFGGGFLLCLFTGGLFLCLAPFSGTRSVFCQLAPCCQCVVMVCCLFFNFVELFDFWCCSLAQEMSFVVHYLPCFRQWLITCLLSAFLPLFTDGSQRLAPCLSPLLWCTFSNPAPSTVC
jgi:hypothetical protein